MTADTLVFLCAFNEAASLPAVLGELRAELPDVDVLVIDDGSTDDTRQVALDHDAEVVSFSANQGLRAAIAEGYRQAFERGYAYCGRLDADGQHPADGLGSMLDRVRAGECDAAVGSRFLPQSGEYRPSADRLVGTTLLRWLMSARLGQPVTDGTSGMYAVNRYAMRLLAIPYDVGAPEVQGLLRLTDAELDVCEVPVAMRERQHGQSSFRGRRAAHLVVTVTGALIVGEAARRKRRRRGR